MVGLTNGKEYKMFQIIFDIIALILSLICGPFFIVNFSTTFNWFSLWLGLGDLALAFFFALNLRFEIQEQKNKNRKE